MRRFGILPILAAVAVGIVGCTGGAEVTERSATELREDSTERVLALIDRVGAGTPEESTGGGPFDCEGDDAGLQYYERSWSVEVPSGTPEDLVAQVREELGGQGYSIDDSQATAARRSWAFSDGAERITLLWFPESGRLQFSVLSPCGQPG
jgi:hypothetical protein